LRFWGGPAGAGGRIVIAIVRCCSWVVGVVASERMLCWW
jgi:hypothetical protein